jgi:hypothetical protein
MEEARGGHVMFDPACLELAKHFLSTQASDALKHELAQHIQDAIEDWLEYTRDAKDHTT